MTTMPHEEFWTITDTIILSFVVAIFVIIPILIKIYTAYRKSNHPRGRGRLRVSFRNFLHIYNHCPEIVTLKSTYAVCNVSTTNSYRFTFSFIGWLQYLLWRSIKEYRDYKKTIADLEREAFAKIDKGTSREED